MLLSKYSACVSVTCNKLSNALLTIIRAMEGVGKALRFHTLMIVFHIVCGHMCNNISKF